MNLKGVEFVTRDTLNDGRGWIGDVKNMELDIGKLNKIGWTPRLSSLEAVTLTSKELLQESGKRQR
jgi:UDP-glucose 4-epimerase